MVAIQARRRLSKRPWRVDDFDDFLERVYGDSSTAHQPVQLDGARITAAAATAAAAAAAAAAASSSSSEQGVQHVHQQMEQLHLQEAAELTGQAGSCEAPGSQAARGAESPFCSARAVAPATGSCSSRGNTADEAAASATAEAARGAAGVRADSHQPVSPPFRRVMVFVDNAGADIVLGMLPFVRELLRLQCEVVMVANSLPAINDITAAELRR